MLVYFASPYAHEDGRVRLMRTSLAASATAKLAAAGIPVYSPIASTYLINQLTHDKLGWGYWRKVDVLILLRACTTMVVYQIPGWEESTGVKDEIAVATEHGFTIHYCGINETDLVELIERLKR